MFDLKHNQESQPPLLLSIKEAAQALCLSERTIWTLVQTGDLPHVRAGRRLLFSRTTLERWIARQETNGGLGSDSIG